MSEVQDNVLLDDFLDGADLEAMGIIEEGEPTSIEEPVVAPQPSLVSLDFMSLSNMPGVVVGNSNEVPVITTNQFPVERIKFKSENKVRLSILSDQVIMVKTHYDKDVGSNFICFEGDCCNKGLARVRYVYPVLVYDTDAEGKILSKKYKFACICITAQQYEALQTIQSNKGSLTAFDYLVTCSDSKYQSITITEVGNAKWPMIEGCQTEMTKFWMDNMKDILKGVAKEITPEEYARIKGATFADNAESVDFNEVFGN